MKIYRCFLIALISVLLFYTTALAIPKLQLDISDSEYDYGTETVVATTDVFTLYALIDPSLVGTNPFFITAAVAPKVVEEADLGSFKFDGDTIDVTDDMVLSNTKTDPPISPHGIFDTYFTKFDFTLDPSSPTATTPYTPYEIVTAYNVEPDENYVDDDPLVGDSLYKVAFDVDVSSFSDDYVIHFDLYTEYEDKLYVAPYSHDAESSTPVPEPATLILFGMGLAGLAVANRRRKR